MKAARFEMEIGMGSCGSALNIDNENNMIILQVMLLSFIFIPHVGTILLDPSESDEYSYAVRVRLLKILARTHVEEVF